MMDGHGGKPSYEQMFLFWFLPIKAPQKKRVQEVETTDCALIYQVEERISSPQFNWK